jgi:hypothetical protein
VGQHQHAQRNHSTWASPYICFLRITRQTSALILSTTALLQATLMHRSPTVQGPMSTVQTPWGTGVQKPACCVRSALR